MKKILNLTQHLALDTQVQEGVYEPSDKKKIKELLTFEGCPHKEDIQKRAKALADVAVSEGAEAAMIGGAPYLMGTLETALKAAGVQPLYSYSLRDVEEIVVDGATIKKQIHRHLGWIEV